VSAPTEDDISQITFLQAAAAKSPTIAFPTASMPTVNFNLVDMSGNVREAETRKAFLDTGCNVNWYLEKHSKRTANYLALT
jgi:hypothetical protein